MPTPAPKKPVVKKHVAKKPVSKKPVSKKLVDTKPVTKKLVAKNMVTRSYRSSSPSDRQAQVVDWKKVTPNDGRIYKLNNTLTSTSEQARFITYCLGQIQLARRLVDGQSIYDGMPAGVILFITNFKYNGVEKQLAFCQGSASGRYKLKSTAFEFMDIDPTPIFPA